MRGLILAAVQSARRVYWFVARPKTTGVRAVVFCEDGRLVLVRHAYDTGRRLAGGGVKRGESPQDAIVRELREEIGLVAWETMEPFSVYESVREFKRDTIHLFVLRGARLQPRRTWEIAAIDTFAPDSIPRDITPATRRRIAEVLGQAEVDKPW